MQARRPRGGGAGGACACDCVNSFCAAFRRWGLLATAHAHNYLPWQRNTKECLARVKDVLKVYVSASRPLSRLRSAYETTVPMATELLDRRR